MSIFSLSESSRSIILCLAALAILAAVLILPLQLRTNAAKGLIERTTSHDSGLPNYDIRTDKSLFEKVAAFRNSAGKSAVDIADVREAFVRGENLLKQSVPTLKIVYNEDIRIPEVIGPDVLQGRAFLTPPAAGKRADILINFLKENSELIGATGNQIDGLKVAADYTNPDGNLSFVELNQEINGIPVFRGEAKAGFTKQGEMIRVINNLAPGIDYNAVSAEFGDPLTAVNSAARFINVDSEKLKLTQNVTASTGLKAVFGEGDWATTAEKMYFPTEPSVAVPSWRVLIWQPVNAYYVIVDAASGTMLWRKNITEDQTQPATYQVYANPNAMVNSADSPAPLTPGPINPALGTQGPLLNRVNVTRVGNEAPYTFNNNGWITDGQNITDGNANEAGIDRVAPNGVDAPQVGSPNRVFDSTWNPPPGAPPPGDLPLTVPAQRGAVIQMFYTMNLYHDEMYLLGFTEQARNFQQSNFGRGGAELDRISSEGQDSGGTNNANFSTPADGGRGRMQMYIFTGPDPDRDGTTDIDIVYHEATHGTSNRLHGNGSGLSLNMSRGMGEGWSDFYAHAMLSEPGDPLDGVYTIGGYVLVTPTYFGNFYYGIRRFPKARMSFTGGPLNRPHNPMTFADIDGTQVNLNDGAFAPRFTASAADQVHAAGEVWSSALWEVRAKLVDRLGWAVGNRKVLQLVTDGMKLAPLGPTFLTERDAILAAAQASSLAPEAAVDVADVWAGFAIRGMGFSASIQNAGSGAGDARVTEAFDLANLTQTPSFTFSDAGGNNNGFPEPGETLTLNIPLSNNTGSTATGVTLQVVGGGLANYGTIASGTTLTQGASFTVPAGTACGSSITLTFNVTSSLGATSFTRVLIVGVPVTTFTENFDSVTAPNLPVGWLTSNSGVGVPFVSTTTTPDSAPNAMFTPNPSAVGGASLTSPPIPITASAAVVTFRQNYRTESGWDGGAFEISINGGAFTDILTAGGRFIEGGYNSTLGTAVGNPVSGRPAWSGNSGGYITTKAQLPASAAGQNVNLRWLFGSDTNTFDVGWWVDGVQVNGSYGCTIVDNFGRPRADFDGDRRSDLSVFRPSDSNWYLNRSQQGFTAVNFGLSSDIPTPGDFDGDGKADIAVFRPSDGNWYRLNSSNGQYVVTRFGSSGDIPQSGDFDGDGKDDIALWRPSTGVWYWLGSSNGQVTAYQFGLNGDKAVAGDFDGDAKDDIAIWRPSTGVWYRVNSTNGQISQLPFGLPSDLPVQADYDGDRKTDIAVFRPSDGVWYRLNSLNGQFVAINFGLSGDIPVPGDYDGDGKDDQAIYRNGTWYLNRSTSGTAVINFGLPNDIPLPKSYLP